MVHLLISLLYLLDLIHNTYKQMREISLTARAMVI